FYLKISPIGDMMLRKRICHMLLALTRIQIEHLREAMMRSDQYDVDYGIPDEEDEILKINDFNPTSDKEG
ncbi:unnamed protein product, partial [Didymodactylos carnosus]